MAAPRQGASSGRSWKCRLMLLAGFLGLVLLLLKMSQNLEDDPLGLTSSPSAMQRALKEQFDFAGDLEHAVAKAVDQNPTSAQQVDGHAIGSRRVGAPKSSSGSNANQQQADMKADGNAMAWLMFTTCKNGRGVSCTEACKDRGRICQAEALKPLDTFSKMKAAVRSAGGICDGQVKVQAAGNWDGPHLNIGDGLCAFNSNIKWKPNCDLAPMCGWSRLCPCIKTDALQGNGSRKFKAIKAPPTRWWDIPARVNPPIAGDWVSETRFLDGLLRSFGKLKPGYKGPQKLLGFQYGKIFDDKGMFAFEDSVRSVAFDVGAATNPLLFDLGVDNSQVAFLVEPVQWKTVEEDFQRDAVAFERQGGCGKYFNVGICARERALVFPAAVSSELGHADFHVTANPYCGSLEAFTGDTNGGQIAESLKNSKDKDVRGIFEVCYKDSGSNRKVATISLKSILERIPAHIDVKYMKIDAQGHDYKVLLSAGDQISRIQYVRFEMQVDPEPGYRLVKDIPSYMEVKQNLARLGFKHEGKHACHLDGGASPFSKAVKEMECIFCRSFPCIEGGRAPMGPNPGKKPTLTKNANRSYVRPEAWQPPADMNAKAASSSESTSLLEKSLAELSVPIPTVDEASSLEEPPIAQSRTTGPRKEKLTTNAEASLPDELPETTPEQPANELGLSKAESTASDPVPSAPTELGSVAADSMSIHTGLDRLDGPKPLFTASTKLIPSIDTWQGVADVVPAPTVGDWVSETHFLERLLRSFGKQRLNYKGTQKMGGFKPGKIFDEDGMFAFEETVRSVAIDVGAATNPLPFDLDIDSTQVAFFVEPLQWKTLETAVEGDSRQLKARGGCTTRWDPFCVMDRFYIFPAAVSNNLGHAPFHATANPYCGSLEAFTVDTNQSQIENKIKRSMNNEIRGIFEQCYKDAGTPGTVATISLKSIIERIPKNIVVKYLKIDAQGHDFKVLLSAAEQISRIQYVRFEMQIDPPPGRRLVKDIPSYADMKAQLGQVGLRHAGKHACYFDGGASPFSKAVMEMECVFCRKPPCMENGRPPLGENPRNIAGRNWRARQKAKAKPAV